MQAFRIADRRHPIFDGTGAFLYGARWNSPGRAVIYAARSYAGALVEVLVHTNLRAVPKNQAVVTIEIPDSVAVESVSAGDLPGWADEDLQASRAFGDRWLAEARTAVLLVPGVVLQGREQNVLLNPAHPEFGRIVASSAEAVVWDVRLFGR